MRAKLAARLRMSDSTCTETCSAATVSEFKGLAPSGAIERQQNTFEQKLS